MKDYLKGLNPAQHEAVVNTKGPALVIAGAGSGKTRVLTMRIAHLLSNGVRPSEILALTFTNKAAREMKARIAEIVGDNVARYLWMGTFHSIFARILRQEAEKIGFPSNFTIYDSADSKNLLKSIIKEMQLDPAVYKPNQILGKISSAKNDLISAESYRTNTHYINRDRNSKQPETGRIYQIYGQRCKKNSAMDFDDLLLNTNILFRDHPDVLANYQKRYRYLLVDEYQDTNYSQYLIIKKLAANHHNICVVGDDAQSIYAFRGAKIENILNFRTDYPEFKLFKLEQNYRSTQNIVNAANSVIAKNQKQIKKEVFSENQEGNLINVYEAYTDAEEGYIVANKLNDMRLQEHFHYNEFAILYRTNAQSRIFEEALRKKNIPYRIYGGLSFYQRKEIKNILAYCRIVVNPNDNEALKRIINYPKRGIGTSSISKIEQLANSYGLSMWALVQKFEEIPEFKSGGRLQKPLAQFRSLINDFVLKNAENNASDMVQLIAKQSGMLKDLYVDKSPEGVSRYENLQELGNAVQEFVSDFNSEEEKPSLDNYLQNVSLLTDQDSNNEDNDVVSMMTIHSSKGLEFKNVFLVGVEEELFPSQMSVHSASELEEERRLFYVAVTRAEQNIIISYAKSRFRWGQLSAAKPSRFISEIHPSYLDWHESATSIHFDKKPNSYRGTKPTTNSVQKPTSFKRKLSKLETAKENNETKAFRPSALVNLKIGDIVEHQKFGLGKVNQINDSSGSAVAIVEFETVGAKQLLLKFAKLKIVKK